MDETGLRNWFASFKDELETAYVQHNEPWKQSGFSGPEDRWARLRKPIADCIETSGSFLDIGCANGYLLECIIEWVGERGLSIVPYGVDLSEKLIELAKERLPAFKANLYVGNGWSWEGPVKFDYVRTEIVYVPEHLRERYLERIFKVYLKEDGKLLLAEYRSRIDDQNIPNLRESLIQWGYDVSRYTSGFDNNKELSRIYVLVK